MRSDSLPLVVIVGPTASGKTSLAIRIATECNGEIISADSRAVYKGLDIGTAKPSDDEQRQIRHWGIDLVEPDERYTVAEYKRYVLNKIAEIRARGNVPLLVGGTGLFVDSVLFDYQFPTLPDEKRRRDLRSKSVEELRQYCINNTIDLPRNSWNPRHLIAAILRDGKDPQRQQAPLENTIIVGIATEKHKLYSRIQDRVHTMWSSGVIEEASRVAVRYGWETEAMTGNVYPLARRVLAGDLSYENAIEQCALSDRRLAKRQLTWFRRNPYIMWAVYDEAYYYCIRLLKHQNKNMI